MPAASNSREYTPAAYDSSVAGATADVASTATLSEVHTAAEQIQLTPDVDEALGDFLWDALAGFDSNIDDLTDLCM